MQLQDTFKVTGDVFFRRYDENGVVNLEREHKNLVVTTGKQLIASRLFSDTTKNITITATAGFINLATTAVSGNGTIATISFAEQTAAPFIVGTDITVDGVTPLGYNTTPTLAITGASGTGSIATVTFATQPVAPFVVGEQILVSGISPSGYNATAVVTACTTNSVSYANTTASAYVSGGKVRTELLTTAVVTACTTNSVSYANTTTSTPQTVAGIVQPIGATLAFATQTGAPYYGSVPFEQGANVKITGVVPNVYNGTFRIKTVGTTFITIDSTATGVMTEAGVIKSLDNGTIKKMVLGENNTAANLSDKALLTPLSFSNLFSRAVTTDNDAAKITYIALFPAGNSTSANGIAEAALMNEDNIMLCRTVFPLITKSSGESLEIFWTVTIN